MPYILKIGLVLMCSLNIENAKARKFKHAWIDRCNWSEADTGKLGLDYPKLRIRDKIDQIWINPLGKKIESGSDT